MKPNTLRPNLRAARFVVIIVSANLAGNVLLRTGMSGSTAFSDLAPMAYMQALLNPWVLTGVPLLMAGLAVQLALLSWADLSYVTPVMSIGYVLTALAGSLFLHESMSMARWGAILFITAGVALVSRTPPSTAGADQGGTRR